MVEGKECIFCGEGPDKSGKESATWLPTITQSYPQRYKVTHKDTRFSTKIQGYPQRYRVTHKERTQG